MHQNKFGQNCKQCHSESSFHTIKSIQIISIIVKPVLYLKENILKFPVHRVIKQILPTPLKHNNCTDCHTDYHKGQFAQSGKSPDCSKCHTVKGFTPSNFTIEQHNQGEF